MAIRQKGSAWQVTRGRLMRLQKRDVTFGKPGKVHLWETKGNAA